MNKGKKLEALLLNVIERCNFSCTGCIYSNWGNEDMESMSFETAKKAIDEFIPLSAEKISISFWNGEALNNMNLIKEIIDYTKRKYPKKTIAFSTRINFCDSDKWWELYDLV